MLTKTEVIEEEKVVEDESTAKMTQKSSSASLKRMANSTTSLHSEKENKLDPEEDKGLLKKLEDSSKGKVKGSLYLNYFKSANRPFTFVFLVVTLLLSQILASLIDIWVAFWIRIEESRAPEIISSSPEVESSLIISANSTTIDLTSDAWSTETYTYIYGAIMASLIVVTLARSMTFFGFCATASQNLHDMMFRVLIATKMRFFDTNPSGRIMNRFSKDMGSSDEALPKAFLDALQFNFTVVGAIVVTIYTNTKLTIVLLVLGIIFWLIRRTYLKCSMNLKRLEGTSEFTYYRFFVANENIHDYDFGLY